MYTDRQLRTVKVTHKSGHQQQQQQQQQQTHTIIWQFIIDFLKWLSEFIGGGEKIQEEEDARSVQSELLKLAYFVLLKSS